jgi:hypothetical protein
MAAFAEPQDTPVAAEAGEAAEAPSAVAEEGNPGAAPAPEAQAGDSNDAAPAQDGEAGEPGGEASADTADATDEAASGAAEGDPAAEVTGEAATEAPADEKKSSSHTLYNTATAPSGTAETNAKYLVRLINAVNGKYYIQNGFGNYFKPSDLLFDAVAAGRLLILSPWTHNPDKRTITRAECVALNQMAEEISAR